MTNDEVMGNIAWLGCWIVRGIVLFFLFNIVAAPIGLSVISGAIFAGVYVFLSTIFMNNIVEEGRAVNSRWIAVSLINSGIVLLIALLLQNGIFN